MYLITLLGVSLYSSFITAAVLSPRSGPLHNALTSSLLFNNTPNATYTPSNVLRIQCDGIHYSHNLNPSSCRDVFNYIGKSDEQVTFSERHTGRPNDVGLPFRIMSSDGLCFVQPLLVRGASTARATLTQIGQTAYTLFQRCVIEKGIGGIAASVGASLPSYKSV